MQTRGEEYIVTKGETVKLTDDVALLKAAVESTTYSWTDDILKYTGKDVVVQSVRNDGAVVQIQNGLFGLNLLRSCFFKEASFSLYILRGGTARIKTNDMREIPHNVNAHLSSL